MSEYDHLKSEERDRIAELKASGLGVNAIARDLGRDKSTISRELKRNSQDSGAYRPDYADGSYLYRRQRHLRLDQDERLRSYVVDRLVEGWTPEQIAGRLKTGIDRLDPISHETIYAWIYSKARRPEKLWRYLPRRRATRRPMKARRSKDRISGKTHISERSEAANTRAEGGHWESDLVICKKSRPILVLHERKTRLTLMARLSGKTAAETVSTIMAVFKRLSPDMRRSATFDNGSEFARHSLLRSLISETTYFCDAYASWQKGGIENANGRIRRWLPRNTDLDDVTDEDIQDIALTINTTPRKCLGFKSPIEAFLNVLGKSVSLRFYPNVALRS